VRAALSAGLQALLANEPAARAGEPEGVHQMRTAGRRMRGELRAFRPLIDANWAEALVVDLRWLGGVLGAARDLDVLRAGLAESAVDLREPLAPLFAVLDERCGTARAVLREALESDRYRSLLERLARSAREPSLTAAADEPCRDALPPLVAELWERLKKRGRRLQPTDSNEAFHAVRIRAKRVRYAGEAASRALGTRSSKAAARFARRAKRVQDALGRHQDAVVAASVIEREAAARLDDAAFQRAAGRLIERQAQAARTARAEFARAWKKLDRKRVTSWMKR